MLREIERAVRVEVTLPRNRIVGYIKDGDNNYYWIHYKKNIRQLSKLYRKMRKYQHV